MSNARFFACVFLAALAGIFGIIGGTGAAVSAALYCILLALDGVAEAIKK